MVNWVAVILLIIALVLLFISAIIISSSIRQTPGGTSNYLNGFGSMVGYSGTVTVDSGKLVSVAVLNWIAFVALGLGLIAVSAKETVNRGLTSVIRTRS